MCNRRLFHISPKPGWQRFTQRPAAHVDEALGAVQSDAHEPQFTGSVARSTQPVAHIVVGAAQVTAPPEEITAGQRPTDSSEPPNWLKPSW